MAKAKYIDIDVLRQILVYSPETGKLHWLKRPVSMFPDTGSGGAVGCAARWNARCAGKEALTTKSNRGYLTGPIFSNLRIAHQVAWALYYGDWPENPIDHINGIRDDNRISNLRCVSYTENAQNQRVPKNNQSGVMGVKIYKPTGRWVASIGVNGKTRHLGYFSTKDDAIKARQNAEMEYGFHANHGRIT